MAGIRITTQIGDVYGDFTVTEYVGTTSTGCHIWIVACQHGHVRKLKNSKLKRIGHCRKCLAKDKDLHGMQFNDWTVIGPPCRRDGILEYLCSCKCGRSVLVNGYNLVRGISRHCLGCSGRRHGHASRGVLSSEYSTWKSMKRRCGNTRCKAYKNYGGRGIKVCPEWMSFERFIADMGPKPLGKNTIERIDSNGDYCPANCRWADRFEQNRNTSRNVYVTHDGKTLTISEWAREFGVHRACLGPLLRKGINLDEAVSRIKNPSRPIMLEYNGIMRSVPELARIAGLSDTSFRKRISKGMSVKDAVESKRQNTRVAHCRAVR